MKVIKTEEEYEEALAVVEQLMDAEPGSDEENELELLSVLIEKYEEEHYPIAMPDPISAIKFRMEQQGLHQKDLIPFIGSQPKVSAVLNRKRPLSKDMIRRLHLGLGIPYEVLMQEPEKTYEEQRYRWEDFPFNEMVHQNYFPDYTDVRRAKQFAEELLGTLFSVFDKRPQSQVFCRSSYEDIDHNALLAYQARVLTMVSDEMLPPFEPSALDDEFFDELLRFSTYEPGIQLVPEHLNKKGIHFCVLKHLSHTRLDGACFLANDEKPVIAMTLRHDRLDNFWFTLFHELGHVKLHLRENPQEAFFDDTESGTATSSNPCEEEADHFARDMMIPIGFWENKIVPYLSSFEEEEVTACAQELDINPAIIAGRLRFEQNNYTIYNNLVGRGQVRHQFTY
jgi:HTH-type transcriptional regulator / antitoxin HigA